MSFNFFTTVEELCSNAGGKHEPLHEMQTFITPDMQQLELSGKSLADVEALDPRILDVESCDPKTTDLSCNGRVCNIGCPKGYITDNFAISPCGTAPPRAPKDAHCMGEFNLQNEEDRKRHIMRIPRWLESGPGPLLALGTGCPDCGSPTIKRKPQPVKPALEVAICTSGTYPLPPSWWAAVSEALRHCVTTHFQRQVDQPKYRPELLEAFFGHEYENFLDVYSQYELDLSFGLLLVPLLSEISYQVLNEYQMRAKHQPEQRCEVPHDTLERVVDLAIAIGRFTRDRGCTGKRWTIGYLYGFLNSLFGPRPGIRLEALWEYFTSVNSTSRGLLPDTVTNPAKIADPEPIELFAPSNTIAAITPGFIPTSGPTFLTNDFNVSSLQAFGGLRIKWTRFFNEHLQLDPGGTELAVFWNASFARTRRSGLHEPSSLFWIYAGIDMKLPPHRLDAELRATYALLFGYPKDQKVNFLVNSGNGNGIVLKDFIFVDRFERNPARGTLLNSDRVDVTRGPAKKLLAPYSQLHAPERLTFFHPRFDLQAYFGRFWTYHKSNEHISLEDIIKRGPPYPMDMLIHIRSILNNPLEESQAFKDYVIWGDRLRQLQALIDQRYQRKPKTFKQLWTDRRDAANYYTFWTVIAVGSISIFLALASLAVTTAQTVASFKQLNQAQGGNLGE